MCGSHLLMKKSLDTHGDATLLPVSLAASVDASLSEITFSNDQQILNLENNVAFSPDGPFHVEMSSFPDLPVAQFSVPSQS